MWESALHEIDCESSVLGANSSRDTVFSFLGQNK